MNKITKTISAVLITLAATGVALAQARSQADVQIRSTTVTQAGDKLTLKFEVFTIHDDDALNTTVRVLFPVGVKFVSSATGCVASAVRRDGTQAFATCDVGRLGVREARTLQVITTVPRILTIRKTFGAFAWSETSDPEPRNNFSEATAP